MSGALKARSALLAILLVLCAATPAAAAANPLRTDTGFGERGRVRASFGPEYKPLGFISVRPEADGSLLASLRDFTDVDAPQIRRYTAAGQVDRGFRAREGSTVEAVDQQGCILRVLGVGFNSRLQRLLPDGAVDPSFGRPHKRGGNSVKAGFPIGAVLPLPSGEIVVAGGGGEYETNLARFDEHGTLEPAFGPPGASVLESYFKSDQQTLAGLIPGPRDDVIIAVNRADVEDEDDPEKPYRAVIAAFDRDGRLDPAFGNAGAVTVPDSISAVAALPGGGVAFTGPHWGHLLAAGYGPVRHHASDLYVATLGPDGRPVDSFGGGEGIANFDLGDIDIPRSLLVSGDGAITVGGAAIRAGLRCQVTAGLCDETPVLLRLAPDGSAATRFAKAGVSMLRSLANPVGGTFIGGPINSAGVLSLAETARGGLIAGGRAGPTGFLASLAPGGRLERSFAKGGLLTRRAPQPSSSSAHAVAVDAEGRTLVAASSTGGTLQYLGEAGGLVARYLPDGTLDPSFGSGAGFVRVPGEFSPTYAMALDGEGGVFVLTVQTFGFQVVHLRADGSLDRRFANRGVTYLPLYMRPFGNGSYTRDAIAALPDGGVVIAGWNAERPQLVRLTAAGKRDPRFGRDGVRTLNGGRLEHCDVKRMAVTRGGRILLAGSVFVREQDSAHRQLAVFGLRPDGALDRRFGDGGIATLQLPGRSEASAVIDGSEDSILVAGKQSENELSMPLLLRLRSDGSVMSRSQAPEGEHGYAYHLRQILVTDRHIFLLSQGRHSLLAFSARGRFEGTPRIRSRWETPIVYGAARNHRVVLAASVFSHDNFILWSYRAP